jgi:hypothetical protein
MKTMPTRRRSILIGLFALIVLAICISVGRAAFRSPWIKVHYREMDANADGALARSEFDAETEKTFTAFDHNKDGSLTTKEYSSRDAHSVMAGYLGFHAREIDTNGDGIITWEEFLKETGKMFDEADANHDSVITSQEFALIKPPILGGGRPRHHGAEGRR